jgi:hypothetical protein
MATVTKPTKVLPPRSTRARIPAGGAGEQRIVIRGLSWDLYHRLADAVGERQHVYLPYDGKDLELMTTGPMHEGHRQLFGFANEDSSDELAWEQRLREWVRTELALRRNA